MKAAGAKYVFITATPIPTAKIIGTAHALGYDPQWILQSPAFATGLLAVPGLAPLLSKAWLDYKQRQEQQRNPIRSIHDHSQLKKITWKRLPRSP